MIKKIWTYLSFPATCLKTMAAFIVSYLDLITDLHGSTRRPCKITKKGQTGIPACPFESIDV